jgi:hypothetical protein
MTRTPFLLAALLLALPSCDLREEELLRVRAEKAQADEKARRIELENKVQQAKIDALRAELVGAKDEATRRALKKQLEEAQAAQRKGRTDCKCVEGDPLCSLL